MPAVTVEREVSRPIQRVWDLVTDFAGLSLPLTRVETSPGVPGVGWRFVGISGVRPLLLRDRMVITRWQPPTGSSASAQYAVVKTGWPLAGWAEVALTELRPSRTQLRWREQIVLHPWVLGAPVARLTDVAVRAMFERMVDDLVRRA